MCCFVRKPASSDIIVDNVNATVSGAWSSSTFSPGFYGADYIQDNNTYPTAYRGWRTTPTASTTSNSVQCFLSQVVTSIAANRCIQDSVTSYNLWTDPTNTPLATGVYLSDGTLNLAILRWDYARPLSTDRKPNWTFSLGASY